MDNFGREHFGGKVLWIAPMGLAGRKNCYFRARRKVSREALGNGVLSIAAENYYALWANGKFVANGPVRGTYTCNFVDEHDINAFLCDGDNTIAIEVFCNNYPTFTASSAEPALFVQIGDIKTDESWDVQIAADWREDAPRYTFQIGAAEFRDMRREPEGWKLFADDSEWQKAALIKSDRPIYSKNLYSRDISGLKTSVLKPVAVPVISSVPTLVDPNDDVNLAELITGEEFGQYVGDFAADAIIDGKPAKIMPQPDDRGVAVIVDFGQAFIGGMSLDVDAQDGTIMDVCYDEIIEDGKIKPARSQYYMADRYILKQGRQILSNRLHCRGGRYMQLIFRNFDKPITIHKFDFIDKRYPIDAPSHFECSDETLNILWDKCFATMSACATDTFLDCPWREMAFWVNDFIVQQEFWQQLVGRQDLVKRSLSLALSQPASKGLTPGVCPFDGIDNHILFPTNLFLAIILRDFEKYTDDNEYVEIVLPEIEKIFNICQQFSDENMLLNPPAEYWNFIDWSYGLCKNIEHFDTEGYPLEGRNTCIVNWFNCLAADAVAELYSGCNEDKSKKYTKLAKEISVAIVAKFWNDELDCFNEFIDQPGAASKISHALAILSGRLPQKYFERCGAALLRDDCLNPELYMMHFVFKALAATGNRGEIMKLIEKYWQPMVESDCPTIWEANVHEQGKQAFFNAGSMCHAFSLAPVSFLQQEILGIKPIEKGFAAFQVRPHDMGLDKAHGTVNTPEGVIEINWRKCDEGIKVRLVVPGNTKAVCPSGKILIHGKHEFVIQMGK